jgi:hypothetical protein
MMEIVNDRHGSQGLNVFRDRFRTIGIDWRLRHQRHKSKPSSRTFLVNNNVRGDRGRGKGGGRGVRRMLVAVGVREKKVRSLLDRRGDA